MNHVQRCFFYRRCDVRLLVVDAPMRCAAGEKKARSMYAKMTKSLGTGREETGMAGGSVSL